MECLFAEDEEGSSSVSWVRRARHHLFFLKPGYPVEGGRGGHPGCQASAGHADLVAAQGGCEKVEKDIPSWIIEEAAEPDGTPLTSTLQIVLSQSNQIVSLGGENCLSCRPSEERPDPLSRWIPHIMLIVIGTAQRLPKAR